MQHTGRIERNTVGDNLLLGLAVGKRPYMLVDLHRRFGCAAIRTDPIDDAAGAAADEKISLPVKGNAIRAGRPCRKGLRQSRLRRVELSTADANNFSERSDSYEKITLRIKRDALRIGIDSLALDLPRLDATDDNRLRRLGINAENISGNPIGKIKHAAAICGDALDDHRAVRTRRIEIDKYRDGWIVHLRGRAAAQCKCQEAKPEELSSLRPLRVRLDYGSQLILRPGRITDCRAEIIAAVLECAGVKNRVTEPKRLGNAMGAVARIPGLRTRDECSGSCGRSCPGRTST